MQDELGHGWKGVKVKAAVPRKKRKVHKVGTQHAHKTSSSSGAHLKRGTPPKHEAADDDPGDDGQVSRKQNVVILAAAGAFLIVVVAVAFSRGCSKPRYSRVNADYSDEEEDDDDANDYDSDALDEYEDDDDDSYSEGSPRAKHQPKPTRGGVSYSTGAEHVGVARRHPNQEPSPSDQELDRQDRASQPGSLSRRRGRGASTPPPSRRRVEAL